MNLFGQLWIHLKVSVQNVRDCSHGTDYLGFEKSLLPIASFRSVLVSKQQNSL